jgi:hypothetical protein
VRSGFGNEQQAPIRTLGFPAALIDGRWPIPHLTRKVARDAAERSTRG